jgi:hypothetical protein
MNERACDHHDNGIRVWLVKMKRPFSLQRLHQMARFNDVIDFSFPFVRGRDGVQVRDFSFRAKL